MKTTFLSLIPLSFLAISANAENESRMTFSHLNIENGLNSNTIQCISQDSEGLMWFGTNDGLVMYDTYGANTWRNEPENPFSIGNNSIYNVFEDRQKRIWVGTERGLYIYDKGSDSFSTASASPSLKHVHVRSITQDRQGDIWISTLGDGIFCINPSTGDIRNWRHDPQDDGSIGSDYCPRILADAMGNIWCLASGSYLYRYDQDTSHFTAILIRDTRTGRTEKNAFSMCLDWEGNLWIGGWDSGLFHYDKESGDFTNHLYDYRGPALKGRIHTIVEPEPGRLLIGSDAGLTNFNYDSGKYVTTSYSSPSDSGLSDDFVHEIFIDKEGGMWIGTYFGGVNYMNPNSYNFILEKCTDNSAKGRVISKFCENGDGRIWVGTDDGGLFIYDPVKKECNPVLLDRNIPNLNIHAILKDGNSLWVGTYSDGLYRMDLRTRHVDHFKRFDIKETIDQSIYSLYKDHTDRLWIGTKTAIWTWTEGKGFTRMKNLGFHSDIISICGDTKGNIWFASISNGLFRYDPRTQDLSRTYGNSEEVEIPDEILSMSIHTDQIYLGTAGRGVVRYDIGSGKTEILWSASCNMLDMSVFHIINDENDIWMSTNEGLIRYNISSGKANIFGKADGLKTDIFNSNSGIKAADGNIYLGTNDGFNIFNPETIKINLTAPNTTFTRCTFPNLRDKDNIVIRKGHDPFTIGFAALSYRSSHKNRYRYVMEGLDDNWHEASWDNNSVTFSDLKCGLYTFKVCSCNNDGIWGDPISATITVKPHWWNCTAAIVTYIFLGVLFLGALVISFITHTIQKKKSRAQKIKYVKEKTRIETELQFFTNLAHEIRTPVMLINAPANEIAEMKDLPKKVLDNIALIKKSSDKLSGLTNEILDFRKCSSDTRVSPMQITLLTKQIVNDFIPVTISKGITLRFIDKTDGKSVANVNAGAWDKILNNLITNAMKFATDLIEVRAEVVKDKLCISVYDNGPGIAQDELKKIFQAFWHYDKTAIRPTPGFGLGLSISSMLAHKMGMKISVSSEQGKFTEVTVTVPLSDAEVTEEEIQEVTAHVEDHERQKKSAPQIMDNDLIPKGSNTVTLLIVDDDDDLRLYLASVMSENYRILTASDGDEALQMLRSGQMADLVISDIMMPKMDGIELCNQMRKDINLSHIPIILLSADSDMETRKQSAENGSDMYIDKPVDIDYLKTQVHNLLERRRVLWDSFSKRPYLALHPLAEDDSNALLLKRFSDVILKDMANQDLSVNDIADQLHMSRSILFKKIKAITGMTPNNFIKTMRLRKAAELLVQGRHKINEICWTVGFNTPSYFSKCFHKHFGMNPNEFAAKNRNMYNEEGTEQ